MRLIILTLLILLCMPVAWGANVFVDASKTGGTGSGADTTNAYLLLETAMEAARTAGDTIFVRSTHVETISAAGGNIDPVSDGTAAAPIVVWGDDGTKGATGGGPWPNSTLDSTPPTLTCNDNYMYLYTDDYWHIHNIKFDSMTVNGLYIRHYLNQYTYVTNCTFTNPAEAVDCLINITGPVRVVIENCTFDGGGTGEGIHSNAYNESVVRNCSFDDLHIGVFVAGHSISVYDCVFGNATANTSDLTSRSTIRTASCTVNKSLIDGQYGGYVYHTYIDDSKRQCSYIETSNFAIDTDYSIANAGSDYSLKTNSAATVWDKVDLFKVLEYSVPADSAETRSYTIAAYRDANWTPLPAATELYLEATYWAPLGDTLTTKVSTATLPDSLAWVDLTVADVEPGHGGPVMLTLWLKDYDADGYIYIDPKLEATGEDYNPTYHWGVPSLAYNYTPPAAGNGQIWIWN